MPDQNTAQTERQVLQDISIRNWERERQARIDGYASALSHLNAALRAVPMGDDMRRKFAEEIDYIAHNTRGRMRAIFQETNPFVRAEKS